MSLYDYLKSQKIEDYPFYSLIMAAMRKADDRNIRLLREAWPDIWNEFLARYHAPGGILPNETTEKEKQ